MRVAEIVESRWKTIRKLTPLRTCSRGRAHRGQTPRPGMKNGCNLAGKEVPGQKSISRGNWTEGKGKAGGIPRT